MRKSEISRKTTETDIKINLNLDGTGQFNISSGCPFFNHMLELFACHASFDLKVHCIGDTGVDYHHTVEDIGICLGAAFKNALNDKKGIRRYADKTIPMDEALILCAVDISGRSYVNFDVALPSSKVGDFDTELVWEFLNAFTRSAGITVHVKMLYGYNTHHIIECFFKCFARALRESVSIDESKKNILPTTKGILD